MTTSRTVSDRDVHGEAHGVLLECLKFQDYSKKCSASVVISVVLFAATRAVSLTAACRRLMGVPSEETLRQALLAMLPPYSELERRINAGLASHLPKALYKNTWPMAVDLCDLPYYGQPDDPQQVRRGKAKRGTGRFHTYATAFVVYRGHRFTLAAVLVQRGETPAEVLTRLLQQVSRLGIRTRYLLLDREFYQVEVVRYLQRARRPFVMPVVHRGRRPKDPSKSKGTRRFLSWRHSGWSSHTWSNREGLTATVKIGVSQRLYVYRGKQRQQTLVFACWGFSPRSTTWLRETYRKRFGIETSFRQVNQARIRTSTRDPLRRFLFVGIALIVRNLWAWFHRTRLAVRGRVKLRTMPFVDMLHAIHTFVAILYQCIQSFHAPNATSEES